jgi:MFS family permease
MTETTPAPAPATTKQVARSGTGIVGLVIGYFGSQLIVNIANGGAANSLLPNLIAQVDEPNKVAILGLGGGVAAVAALVTQPLWGLLSDRTRSRWGRRVPWMLAGVIGLALAIVGFSGARSVPVLIGLAALVAIFYGMIAGPIAAIVPDRTPVEKRGLFSAFGGLGVFMGGLIGVIVGSQFVSDLTVGFIVLAAILVIGSVPLILAFLREPKAAEPVVAQTLSFGDTLRGFFVNPRTHPDFAWAFLARLLLIVGYWSVISFQLYILSDYIGLGLAKANTVFPVATALLAGGIIVALIPSGLISDRIGRRKPIVIVASVVIAVSTVLPIISPTVTGALVSIGIAGLGIGIYLAVDQALMTQVLPDNSTSAGKDLGVLNIAQAGGQVIAPLVASLVIGIAGYPGLYVFAGIMALLAAVAILPIKSVR